MCCGRNPILFSQSKLSLPARRADHASPPARVPRSNVAYFEYNGKTALTVIGPVSGVRYRFAAPGSRVAVDPRDRRSLAAVRHLAQVRSL
jgi:hypothetical protein